MKKFKIVILLGIMILGTVLLTGCVEITQNQTATNQEATTIQECQHDWIISSEYSWLTSSYRTVSKCSKCGKVVK